MTSSNPNYHPKAPCLNIIVLGVRVSTYEMGSGKSGTEPFSPSQESLIELSKLDWILLARYYSGVIQKGETNKGDTHLFYGCSSVKNLNGLMLGGSNITASGCRKSAGKEAPGSETAPLGCKDGGCEGGEDGGDKAERDMQRPSEVDCT